MDELKETKLNKVLLGIAFGLFLLVLIWVLVFKCADILTLSNQYTVTHATASYNQMFKFQFKTTGLNTPADIGGVFIMILMFIPFGIFLPLCFDKDYSFFRDFGIMVLVTLVVELIQWLSRLGIISYLDFIFEMLGFVIGSILYKFVIAKYMNNKGINIMNLVFTIILIPVALYAIIITALRYDLYIPYYSEL